jgi:hypothetical protein
MRTSTKRPTWLPYLYKHPIAVLTLRGAVTTYTWSTKQLSLVFQHKGTLDDLPCNLFLLAIYVNDWHVFLDGTDDRPNRAFGEQELMSEVLTSCEFCDRCLCSFALEVCKNEGLQKWWLLCMPVLKHSRPGSLQFKKSEMNTLQCMI